jgi:hypothetical protein
MVRGVGFLKVREPAYKVLNFLSRLVAKLARRESRFSAQLLLGWIWNWDCPDQTLGIWMLRVLEDLISRANFHQLAILHNSDSVAQNIYDAKVVADEEAGEFQLSLELLKQL